MDTELEFPLKEGVDPEVVLDLLEEQDRAQEFDLAVSQGKLIVAGRTPEEIQAFVRNALGGKFVLGV